MCVCIVQNVSFFRATTNCAISIYLCFFNTKPYMNSHPSVEQVKPLAVSSVHYQEPPIRPDPIQSNPIPSDPIQSNPNRIESKSNPFQSDPIHIESNPNPIQPNPAQPNPNRIESNQNPIQSNSIRSNPIQSKSNQIQIQSNPTQSNPTQFNSNPIKSNLIQLATIKSHSTIQVPAAGNAPPPLPYDVDVRCSMFGIRIVQIFLINMLNIRRDETPRRYIIYIYIYYVCMYLAYTYGAKTFTVPRTTVAHCNTPPNYAL